MIKNNPYNTIVNYNKNVGAVYNLPTAKLLKVSPDIAKTLKNQLEKGSCDEETKKFLNEFFADEPIKKVITGDFLKEKSIRRVQILVTNYCNLDCVYCYANGGSYNQTIQTMSTKTADRIIDTLCKKVNVIDAVQFFGGEPLQAHKLIMYICDRLNERLEKIPEFSMVSNFTVLPEEFIEYIKKYNINITASIDGPPNINDKLRVYKNRNDSTFIDIKNNIEKLRKFGCDISAIECTYTNKHKEMNISKSFLKKYFKETFQIETVIFGDEDNVHEDEKMKKSDYDDFILSFKEKDNQQIDIDKLLSIKKVFNKRYSGYHCGVGFNSISFFPNGDLYPCHSFASKKDYCMGNIYDSDVFDSQKFKNIRNILDGVNKLNEKCINCSAQNICSQCPASIILRGNNGFNNTKCEEMVNLNEELILEIVEMHNTNHLNELLMKVKNYKNM